MTKQSEHFINSDFLSLQSDWTVSKEAAATQTAATQTAATQTAAVFDLQTYTQLCCDGGGGRCGGGIS
jgi:hypothetical protein